MNFPHDSRLGVKAKSNEDDGDASLRPVRRNDRRANIDLCHGLTIGDDG